MVGWLDGDRQRGMDGWTDFFFKLEISKFALPGVMIEFDLANEARKKGMDRQTERWSQVRLAHDKEKFSVQTRFPHCHLQD